MSHRTRALLLSLVAVPALIGCSGAPQLIRIPGAGPTVSAPTVPAASLARDVHDLVNRRRQSAGLPPLTWDATLAALAEEHSARMADRSRAFGHDGFDDRVAAARASIGISQASENVATNNYPDPQVAQQAVGGWVNSPGHRQNLEGEFQLTGVGVARSPQGDYFITQIYAGR